MFRRLINRLQGKVWKAKCKYPNCFWHAGREDLTLEQANNRAAMHYRNNHQISLVYLNRGVLLQDDRTKTVNVTQF